MSILERIRDTPTRDDHDVFVKERQWRETVARLAELTEHHDAALALLEPFFAAVRAGSVEWDRDRRVTFRCGSTEVAEVVKGILLLRDWNAIRESIAPIVYVYQ